MTTLAAAGTRWLGTSPAVPANTAVPHRRAGLTARGKGFTDLGYVRRSRPGRWRAMVPVEKAGHATGRVSAQQYLAGKKVGG